MRAALLALALLLGGPGAKGQILSLHPPREALNRLLDVETGRLLRMESLRPWGLEGVLAGELETCFPSDVFSIRTSLGWQDWQGLQAHTLELEFLGPASLPLRPGILLRGESFEGRRCHTADVLLQMKEPLALAMRFRFEESGDEGISARSGSEAFGIALGAVPVRLAWTRIFSPLRSAEDHLQLSWRDASWWGRYSFASTVEQELELGWAGRRLFASLRTIWHPWLGTGRGLTLGMRL